MQVTRLATYPLKSAAGVSAQEATLTSIGLEHDRRWAVLDPDGRCVTARECHGLLGITASPTPTGLRLADRSGAAIEVGTPDPATEGTVPVQISRLGHLVPAAPEADAWLTGRLGRELRLAHLADPCAREIGTAHGGRPGETMSLADAGPLLLVTDASVMRLSDLVAQETGEPWLDHDEATERFRPTVVVDGDEPFAEDTWARVRIGDATFRTGEDCDRCVLTTIDVGSPASPGDLRTGPEPIRTLSRHRRHDGRTWFGIRLIPELAPGATAMLRVGDSVEVLERRPGMFAR